MSDQQTNLDEEFNKLSDEQKEEITPPFSSPPYYSENFSVPEPKPKSNLLKIIIIIMIGLFLGFILATGIALVTRIWDPLWNPFRPKPEKVISKMTEKMKEVKTLHNDINIEVDIKNKLEFSIKGKFWADSDNSDPENLKTAGGIDANFAMEGMQFSFGLEGKQIGKTSYTKITTLPVVFQPFLQIMKIDVDSLKNQWIKTDEESIKELFKKIEGEKDYEEWMKDEEEIKKKQEKIIEEFKKIIKNKQFYFIKKELPDEEIDNKKVYHYIIVLKKEEIKSIIIDIFKIISELAELEKTSISFLSKEELKEELKELQEEFEKEIDNFFEKAGELSGELWIGKKDNFLYRFKGEKKFFLSEFQKDMKGTVIVKLDINLSKFNQPIKIKAPDKYKTLEEILSPLIDDYKKLMKTSGDYQIINEASKIRTVAELLYEEKNSYKSLCSNGRLNKNVPNYGKELDDFQNDIQKLQRKNLDLNCYSSTNSYCLDVDLISPDKGRWCIDSSFTFKEIPDNYRCIGNGTTKNPYRCPNVSITNFELQQSSLQFQPQLQLQPESRIINHLQSSLLNSFLKIFKNKK